MQTHGGKGSTPRPVNREKFNANWDRIFGGKKLDRRQEFANVRWQQGRCLLTDVTRRWPCDERERTDIEEQHRLYANFAYCDEGRSRVLLYVFDTPEECIEAVYQHNNLLGDKNVL